MNFKLKSMPEDFRVVESLVLPVSNQSDDKYYYYSVSKKNVSTFDVVRILSKKFKLDESDIRYAGLKDEDGITTQTISTTEALFADKAIFLNEKDLNIENSFIRIYALGKGKEQVRIGSLIGNNFRIVVRGIAKQLADDLEYNKKFTDFFINYYGTQRFGLPKQKKNTHVIGKFLYEKEYDNAIKLLAAQDSVVGCAARKNINAPKEFFMRIDGRQIGFFLNSYESFKWNEKLKRILNDNLSSCYTIDEETLKYIYCSKSEELLKVYGNYQTLPYKRVLHNDKDKCSIMTKRNTLIQAVISCHRVFVDSDNNMCCELSFFLPSGCYATMAVDQILKNRALRYKIENIYNNEEHHDQVCY